MNADNNRKNKTQFKVAAVQAVPVFMDLAGSITKTVELITEAASNGASFVAFNESWIPGHPFWAFTHPPFAAMSLFQAYRQNSLAVDSEEMRIIQTAARDNSIYVMLGFSERGDDSLYISQALIDDEGNLVFSRRKLKPTMAERMVFGEGDGSDLVVAETNIGRIGGLCCWEHMGLLNEFALHAQREQIHVSAWPSFALTENGPYAFGHEVSLALTRSYAVQGQCFVLAPSNVIDDVIMEAIKSGGDELGPFCTGGAHTMIFGPDGRELTQPIGEHEEGILYADIDLNMIDMCKVAYDGNGHYARSDVVRLWLNDEPQSPVRHANESLEPSLEIPSEEN